LKTRRISISPDKTAMTTPCELDYQAEGVEYRMAAEQKQVDINKGVLSFGSMTLVVGGLALAGLLFWGWNTGQDLPLWPALLVVGVNVFGAVRLVMETRARQAARRAAAQAARSQREGRA
jgi:hypothetical protein